MRYGRIAVVGLVGIYAAACVESPKNNANLANMAESIAINEIKKMEGNKEGKHPIKMEKTERIEIENPDKTKSQYNTTEVTILNQRDGTESVAENPNMKNTKGAPQLSPKGAPRTAQKGAAKKK